MVKIGLVAWFGGGNAGDEAMLYSIAPTLLSIPDAEIHIFTREPWRVDDFCVKCLPIADRKKVKIVKQKFWNPFFIVELLDFAKHVKKLDVVVIGGGGLLKSYGFKYFIPENFLNQWLLRALIAKLFKKQVMFFGVGVGEITGIIDRITTRFVMNRVDCISVRDEEAKNYLQECGVSRDDIHVTADPALLLSEMIQTNVRIDIKSMYPNNKKKLIGICVRQLYKPKTENKEKQLKLVDSLVLSAQHLIQKCDMNIVLFTIKPRVDGDRMMIIEMIEKIGEPKHVKAIFFPLTPPDYLEIISQMDLLISIKMHSLIFATQVNTPMIGISYDPKVKTFLKMMDMEEYSISPDTINSANLLAKINKLIENDTEIRKKIGKGTKQLQKKARQNFVILEDLLRRYF